MLEPALAPGLLHKNPPHRLGRRGKEMTAAVPALRLRIVGANQPQVRFVHQGSRLQRLARLLLSEFRGSELTKFVVDQWQQPLGGVWITVLDLR